MYVVEEKLKELKTLNKEIENLEKHISKLKEKAKKLSGEVDTLNKKDYYVYLVFVDFELRYVGKGRGDRWKHAIGGASSVPELNRDHFNNRYIEVRKFIERLSEKEALEYEAQVIGSTIYITGSDKLYNKRNLLKEEDCMWDADFYEHSEWVSGGNNGKNLQWAEEKAVEIYKESLLKYVHYDEYEDD